MTLAEVPPSTPPAPAAAPTARGPLSHRAPVTRGGPTSRAPRGVSPGPVYGRPLAIAFAVAWLLCPAVEPLPEHEMAYPLWQLPLDLGTVGSIVLAVTALWRGSRHAPRLGIAAGVFMAVMTMVCPLAGHGPVGWWTWVQAAMSLFVLLTSATLVSRWPGATTSGR
jgi:hypothetical protein